MAPAAVPCRQIRRQNRAAVGGIDAVRNAEVVEKRRIGRRALEVDGLVEGRKRCGGGNDAAALAILSPKFVTLSLVTSINISGRRGGVGGGEIQASSNRSCACACACRVHGRGINGHLLTRHQHLQSRRGGTAKRSVTRRQRWRGRPGRRQSGRSRSAHRSAAPRSTQVEQPEERR